MYFLNLVIFMDIQESVSPSFYLRVVRKSDKIARKSQGMDMENREKGVFSP